MNLDGATIEVPEAAAIDNATATERVPHKPWPLGIIAFVIALVLLIAEIVAVYLSNAGEWNAATIIAWILVVATVIVFVLGLLAVIRARNLRWGIAAMAVAVAANPLVLVNILSFFSTF